MKRRVRATVTLESDHVSPDSIKAANEYLTMALIDRAWTTGGETVNWNTWHCISRNRANGDLSIVQWARVL